MLVIVLIVIELNFVWIPSHSGFLYNDWADRAAKLGASNIYSQTIKIPLSSKEIQNSIENKFVKDIKLTCNYNKPCGIARSVSSMAHRIILNSIKTKYCKNVKCIWGESISLTHVLLQCINMRPFLPTDVSIIDSIDEGPVTPQELCWSVLGAVKKNHHRWLPFTRSWPPLRQRRIRSAIAYGPSYRSESFELHKILRAVRSGQFSVPAKFTTAPTTPSQSLAPLDASS